ncbi:NHL repeat-containing protein [Moheibacter sediminis]|uniref:NHL repeat-containing protein n=1 Tax=Moheibacter sediminis TaxID=1434700 RepID=A0A1W2AVT1_9FLAO|nr:hypothetical protein [Moheibacter sediminis]SMC64592.1 NHL repeat-containing protein [Moheibacter sediminis]
MKNTKISILSLFLFGLIISCKSDDDSTPNLDNNPDPVVCTIPNITNSANKDFINPCAIAVSADGRIAITTYNGFDQGYGSQGVTKIWTSYTVFANNQPPVLTFNNVAAEGAAFDTSGNLFIAETEQVAGIAVYLKNQNGYTYSHTIQGNLNNPRGIAFDNGKLYIADDGNGRIVSVQNPASPNYVIQNEFPTNGSVKAITADEENFYYVQFAENKVVKRSKADGTIQNLNVINPVDITLHDGNLYVTSPTSKKLTVISAEIFSEECMETKDGLNASFATAYYPQVGLLLTAHDLDKINILSLQ